MCIASHTTMMWPQEKRDAAHDAHRRLWPGYLVPAREIGFARAGLFASKKAGPGEETKQPSLWGDCNVEPTTVMMAYLFWGLSNPSRHKKERFHAFSSMKSLLVKLLACSGGTYLEVPRANAASMVVVKIDETGCVPADQLFSLRFMKHLEPAWSECRVSTAFPYIQSAVDKPTVWELIMFAVDPNSQCYEVTQQLQHLALRLFAHCAVHLDEQVLAMSGDPTKRHATGDKSRRASLRTSFATMLGTGQRMWADSLKGPTKDPCS